MNEGDSCSTVSEVEAFGKQPVEKRQRFLYFGGFPKSALMSLLMVEIGSRVSSFDRADSVFGRSSKKMPSLLSFADGSTVEESVAVGPQLSSAALSVGLQEPKSRTSRSSNMVSGVIGGCIWSSQYEEWSLIGAILGVRSGVDQYDG